MTAADAEPIADLAAARLQVHETIAGFITQYGCTVLEVSLVLAKYTRLLVERLQAVADEHGEHLPPQLTQRWPTVEDLTEAARLATVEGAADPDPEDGLPELPEAVAKVLTLDRMLELLDRERLDILDTLVRASAEAAELPLAELLLLLRQWEWLIRRRLATASHPRHLLQQLELPEDF